MPSSFFMKRGAQAPADDKYTRDDTPRTRPRPSDKPRDATTSAAAADTTTTARQRKRMSMTSTLQVLKHPREWRSRLPAVFNILRFVIYGVVIVWTVVCLAIAVHLEGVLQPSELTAFVPFAIFVSIASVLIFPALLAMSLWKREANPISTRIELGCLGLAGTLWIALGAFMGTSDAEVAEVECYASENDTEPVSLPGFTTETFHAQYHVLEAFSLFNAVLIWGFLIFATILAFRHHRRGSKQIWSQPVTSLPWSGQGVKDTLPDPALQRNPKAVHTPAAEKAPAKDDYFGASRGRSAAATPYWTPAGSTPAVTAPTTPAPGPAPRAGAGYTMWTPNMPTPKTALAPPPAAKQPAAGAAKTTRPMPNRYNTAPLHRSGTGGSSTAPLFKRDGSPQRHDSYRSARSQTADRWARGASPTRQDSGARARSSSRDPQRKDSARTGVPAPQRQDSGRREASAVRPAARDPQRQDSGRREPGRSTSRDPQRQASSRSAAQVPPQRKDSSRSEPAKRTDSTRREPQRTDSARRDPQRSDSTRADRWGRDASPRR